jgi:hypothetical protein
LDELAQLGQAEEKSEQEPVPQEEAPPTIDEPSGSRHPTRGLSETPPVVVKPKPIVPAPKPSIVPANAVALEPLPPMAVVEPPAAARPNPAGIHRNVPAPSLAGASPEEILAGLAGPAPVRTVESNSSNPPFVSGYSLKWLIVVGLISGLIGCAFGWGLGRILTPTPRSAVSQEESSEALPEEATGPLLQGRITFRNDRGQLEPDAGACLILLPIPREGVAKLASDGLRPNDGPAAHDQARAALEQQGGRLAFAKADGSYRVELPAAGNYQLIVLSHFQGRSADEEGSEEARKSLGEIFERPEQLVGKLAFHLAEINLSDTGTVIWDYGFPR